VIESLVEQIESRFAELSRAMTDPEVINDRQRYADVGREYARLEGPAKLAEQWRRAADDAAGAQELLDEGEDPEVRDMLAAARRRLEELDEEIRLAMVERDPADDKDVIVEVQGGAGGEEAGLWAGDVYRMLTKYAERLGFKVQPLEIGDGKYTFAIHGDGAYSVFKYEGGTHRVQRVPVTESQGRIHTSTCTSLGSMCTSTSSASGRTVTVADEVWMRPCDSVTGTRCTRCGPPSCLRRVQTPSPFARKVTVV